MHQPCTKVGKQHIIKVGNLSNGSRNRGSATHTMFCREFRLRPPGKGGPDGFPVESDGMENLKRVVLRLLMN
jgi:hypothetical protein